MTFEDYVGVDDAVQTDEALTESDILAELRSTDVDEEEEEDNPDDLEPEVGVQAEGYKLKIARIP